MAYIDETTVMVNNLKTKTWQRSDSAVYSPKNDENLKSVTVYGCVGHPYVMDRPYLCTGTRTRGEELIPFLRRILELRRDGRKARCEDGPCDGQTLCSFWRSNRSENLHIE